MQRNISYYIHKFENLSRDKNAPHQPILLLSIIDAFENGFITGKEVEIIPELIGFFKINWSKYVTDPKRHCRFALPFFHLQKQNFWQLIPQIGCEIWIESKDSMRAIGNLQTAIKYAQIDDELVSLLKIQESRDILRDTIFTKYFPNFTYSANGDIITGKMNDIKSQMVEEDVVKYKKTITELRKSLSKDGFDIEIAMRGGIFKREVPKNYGFTCAVSGYRVETSFNNTTLIEACHVEPFFINKNDRLSNGLALTPTLHAAFDRGLFTISTDYKVIVSNKIAETESPQSLKKYHGKSIILPQNRLYLPDKNSLEWHNDKRFEQ